jgi:hypothetical protein
MACTGRMCSHAPLVPSRTALAADSGDALCRRYPILLTICPPRLSNGVFANIVQNLPQNSSRDQLHTDKNPLHSSPTTLLVCPIGHLARHIHGHTRTHLVVVAQVVHGSILSPASSSDKLAPVQRLPPTLPFQVQSRCAVNRNRARCERGLRTSTNRGYPRCKTLPPLYRSR